MGRIIGSLAAIYENKSAFETKKRFSRDTENGCQNKMKDDFAQILILLIT